jgi:hypothetical protein
MMHRQCSVISLVACALFAVVANAFGHAPVYPVEPPVDAAHAAPVQDHTVSRVYYSESTPTAPETWFVFDAKAGDPITMSLGVPFLARLSNFEPLLALVGPSLDVTDIRRIERGDIVDPEAVDESELPRTLPGGNGVLVFTPYGEKRIFHEHVTGTTSWILIEAEVTAPQTGTYYLVGFQPIGKERDGKLFLTVGTKERFPLRDIFGIFRIRRFVREFHELR